MIVILTHNELVALVESGAIEGVKPEHSYAVRGQYCGDKAAQPSKGAKC